MEYILFKNKLELLIVSCQTWVKEHHLVLPTILNKKLGKYYCNFGSCKLYKNWKLFIPGVPLKMQQMKISRTTRTVTSVK